MALSNEFPSGVLTMGLTPGIDTHLVHPSPALPGGVVGSKDGYLLVRPTSNATTMATLGSNNISTTVIVSSISHIYSLPWMITVAVLLFLLVIVTIFGNFLVILALVKYRNLRSVSNYLIGNLAVSDFLLSVTILPMSAVNQCLGYWVFGEILCKFWLVADVLYCTASIWNLCIIAFDRFTATLYPLWYREKRTVKQGIVYIIIVWVLSFAICVPPLLGWNDFTQTFVYNNQTDTYACMLFQSQGYVIYSASGSFYIPFFITVFMYIRIFGVLRHRIRKMRAAAAKRTKQAKAASKARLPPGSTTSSPAAEKSAGVGSSSVGVNSSSSCDKDKDKETQEIELSAVATDGHAVVVQTEEHSSKSLFGSDSQGENRSDDEDSSTQVRSDHPLYVSSSEAEVITKNGVKCKGGMGGGSVDGGGGNSSATTTPETTSKKARRGNGTEPLVSSNDSKYHHEHLNRLATDSEKDIEHIQIVVTEDSGTMIVPNNNKPGSGQLKVGLKNKLLSVSKEVLHRSDSDKSATGPTRRSINPLKHVNPFKKDRDKARTSQKAKRFDQREVRATIRMAIIIAFFCGCWLGFFIIYVVTAFCPSCKVPEDLYAFIFWLGYSNSAMNPILYTIFNDDFRKAFQKLLGCHTRSPSGSTAGRPKH